MYRFLLRLPATCALPLAVLLTLTGCGGTHSDPSVADAYVAPSSINLRPALTEKNSVVAVLKHGDRVSIVDLRRHFVKVKTEKGIEGWIDSGQLLSPEQWDQIQQEKRRALALPSEGTATVFEALNVHIEPDRQSPALTRIPEAGSVAVLGHKVEPKASGSIRPRPFPFEKPQPLSRRQRKEKQSKATFYLPPKPPLPKPPDNWQELSAERIDGSSSTAERKIAVEQQKVATAPDKLKKPIVLEDWSLVRTKDRQVGWVLTRNLMMSIPDEVAQYAEGKRITSYFDLGSVNDEMKGLKHNWLWTTSSSTLTYDFDAWRVFLWNRRRHRYETSHRERDVEGYFPVEVEPADSGALGRRFQLITKDDDGKLWRRTYDFDGVRVHLVAKEEYNTALPKSDKKIGVLNPDQVQAKLPAPGWLHRHWDALKRSISGEN